MYKSKIILSSVTTLGLLGAGFISSNHLESVNADVDVVKKDVKKQVETIASQIEKLKPKAEVSNNKVYAEQLKPEEVHSQLVENALDSIEESNVSDKLEEVKDIVIENKVSNEIDSMESNDGTYEISDDDSDIFERDEDQLIDKSADAIDEKNVETSKVEPVVETTKSDSIVEQPKVEIPVDKTVEEPKFEIPKLEAPSETEKLAAQRVDKSVEQPIEESKVEVPVEKPVEVKNEIKHVETQTLTNPINDKTNTYPIGQCTWGVKSLADWVGNNWGNANEWGESARKAGYRTGTKPQVGSVIVFPNSIYDGVNYGHVSYVTNVYEDGSIEVMEANYNGNQSIGNYRGKFKPNDPKYGGVYYIYPNA